jgi:hypothetical protein
MKRLGRFGLAIAMLLSVAAFSTGTAFAATSVDSPNKVDSDTVRLNWTGQGGADGACGDQADFGTQGAVNGATADDYLLWIFNTDGGSTTANATLTVDGNTYTSTNGHQFVTPGFDPATIADAHTNFVVATTGEGSWVLTISHGCIGTVEDEFIPPTGHIEGPCADPAYYAIMDNSAGNTLVKFRFRWYNNNGLNTSVKWVPAGDTFTTWQHWAKPGTYVSLSYKDPNTGMWVLLDKELVVKGRYPACNYTPGWTHSAQV